MWTVERVVERPEGWDVDSDLSPKWAQKQQSCTESLSTGVI